MKFNIKFRKVPLWQRGIYLFIGLSVFGGRYLYTQHVVNEINKEGTAVYRQKVLEDMHEACFKFTNAAIKTSPNQQLAQKSSDVANNYCDCVVFRIDDGGYFRPQIDIREVASEKLRVPSGEKVLHDILTKNQWISNTCKDHALKGS